MKISRASLESANRSRGYSEEPLARITPKGDGETYIAANKDKIELGFRKSEGVKESQLKKQEASKESKLEDIKSVLASLGLIAITPFLMAIGWINEKIFKAFS